MSYNKIIRSFLLNLAIFVILLSESNFTGAPAKTDAITDKQRKEIEKMRSQLSDELENEDSATLASKGIIVQPSWTQGSGKEVNENVKVVATAGAVNEVNLLRSEINKAVTQDTYVSTVSRDDVEQAKELDKKYSSHAKQPQPAADDDDDYDDEELVTSTKTKPKQKPKPKPKPKPEEMLGGGSADDDDDDDDSAKHTGPNIVNSNAFTEPEIDLNRLQSLKISKRREREVLVLESVVEDYNFNLGDDVLEWEHIMHGGEEYFIGRRLNDLIIVRKNGEKYEESNKIEVGQAITYLETYSFWNFDQHQQEGIIIIAVADVVLWYRVHNETGLIGLDWEWKVGKAISGLTYFISDTNEYLAVSSNESSRMGFYALNIYQFDLRNKEFWIAQQMQLAYACGEVTILDTGRDIILAVAQNNTAVIYTYNPREGGTDHIRFKLLHTIDSQDIGLIAGFQMGGRSYLALSGYQPQILLYQNGEFVSKTILGNNFGLVELFFPVPVRTYRDDLILLVQHRVDFGTHNIIVLETLIWDGDAFEASIPVPCYFNEHIIYGVGCMLDIQRDEGLIGGALLRRGDEISVIVPRYDAESGLFRLNTKLLAKNSELIDLQDIFQFLQDWVKDQDNLIAKAQIFANVRDAADLQQQAAANIDFSALEELESPEFIFNGEITEIHINDYVWTEEDTKADLNAIMQSIEQLGSSLNFGRQKREVDRKKIFSLEYLDVDEVEIEDLDVEKVNQEIFYIQNGTLDFNGILNLNDLEVLEKVHARESRQTAVEKSLQIDGNIEFNEINGIKWHDLTKQFIFRNVPLTLSNLEVEGDVVLEDDLYVNTLDSLNFPDDYFLASGPTISVVNAEKTFLGNLEANAVDTDGLINGMNPLDAITLSDPQEWKGIPTFGNLEVSEKLELHGTTHGLKFENFPKNPTLQESSNISAACNFKTLIINGNVFLNGQLDNTALSPLLNDVIQKPLNPLEEISIPSKKVFTSIEFPIDFNVASDAINNISIDEFVTVHTSQILNLDVIKGYLYFHDLNVTGLYDHVDIKELQNNSIKIDELQMSENTQLNFVDVVKARHLNVRKSLNRAPIFGYQTIHEDLVLPTAHFQTLRAKVAEISQDIKGENASFNGLNLVEFLQRQNSSNVVETGNIFLDELILENSLEVDKLYGIQTKHLWNFLDQIDELPEMILDGKVQVDHVIVTGDVQLSTLNEQNFDEDLMNTAVWLNRPNFLSTNLTFLDVLAVESDLVLLGVYNEIDLPTFIDDIVFRTPNHSIFVTAPKTFTNNLQIMQNIDVDIINDVPFAAFASKRTSNNFNGTLQIKGNLIATELEIAQNFGKFSMPELKRIIRFDENLRAFVLLGENSITTRQKLNDLTIDGNFNEMQNLPEFFKNFVYKNNICTLSGKTTFTGRVSIENGAYIRNLNGNNLIDLMNNFVMINDLETVIIKSPVTFKAPLQMNLLTINKALRTHDLNGCSLEKWLNDTIRVDYAHQFSENLHFAPNSLNSNSLYVNFINDVNLSQIITLHTEQNLTGNLNFSTVYLDGHIETNGPVNNVDLDKEFENTLLTFGNQHVSTPLTLQSIKVLHDLHTNAPVNKNKNLKDIATLLEPLTLESPMFFRKVNAQYLWTNDSISGIEMNQWFNETLWIKDRPNQEITGNWHVRSLIVKPVASTFNDMTDVEYETGYMRRRRADDNFNKLCEKIKQLSYEQNKRVLYLKHLEKSFIVDLKNLTNDTIRKAFLLTDFNHYYLLINAGCFTYVHKWHTAKMSYIYLSRFSSGPIDEVVIIPKDQRKSTALEFLTNFKNSTSTNCRKFGLSSWQLKKKTVKHLRKFATEAVDAVKFIGKDIYTIKKNELKKISLNNGNSTHTWKLPTKVNQTNYHFVPLRIGTDNVILSNGQSIIELNNSKTSFIKFKSPFLNQQIAALPVLKVTESVLKPNATRTPKLTLADFRQIIERILSDLIYRLQLEVDVTQLSIPESDLYDEHLIEDFIAIMQELQDQEIFAKETFAIFSASTLEMPDNPAQVLAARTIQTIWPSIIEMKEVHSYLSENVTQAQSICACIMGSLGTMVRDMLILANMSKKNVKKDHEKQLISVIERIREFQNDLEFFMEQINADIQADLQLTTMSKNTTDFTHFSENVNENVTAIKRSINNETVTTEDFNIFQLSDHKADEIINFEVGSQQKPVTLYAVVTEPTTYAAAAAPAAGQHFGVKLYVNNLTGPVFQIVIANNAHALVSMRIRDETLLAYVEDCCTLHVLIYRGVQGFVTFAKFKATEKVQQLIAGNLINADGNAIHYFVAVGRTELTFYQVIVAGRDYALPGNLKCT